MKHFITVSIGYMLKSFITIKLSWVGPADYSNSDKKTAMSGTVTILLVQKLSGTSSCITSIQSR